VINGLRYTGKSTKSYDFIYGVDRNITDCVIIKKPTNNADDIDYSRTITVTGRLYKDTSCELGGTPPVLFPNTTLNIYDDTQYENDYNQHLMGTTTTDTNGEFSLTFHPNHSQNYKLDRGPTSFHLQTNKINYNVGSIYIPLCT